MEKQKEKGKGLRHFHYEPVGKRRLSGGATSPLGPCRLFDWFVTIWKSSLCDLRHKLESLAYKPYDFSV